MFLIYTIAYHSLVGAIRHPGDRSIWEGAMGDVAFDAHGDGILQLRRAQNAAPAEAEGGESHAAAAEAKAAKLNRAPAAAAVVTPQSFPV